MDEERRKRGEPVKTWIEDINYAMTQRNLRCDDWNYHKAWKLGWEKRRLMFENRNK